MACTCKELTQTNNLTSPITFKHCHAGSIHAEHLVVHNVPSERFRGKAGQRPSVALRSFEWLSYFIADCIIFQNRYVPPRVNFVPVVYGAEYIDIESLDAVRAVAHIYFEVPGIAVALLIAAAKFCKVYACLPFVPIRRGGRGCQNYITTGCDTSCGNQEQTIARFYFWLTPIHLRTATIDETTTGVLWGVILWEYPGTYVGVTK